MSLDIGGNMSEWGICCNFCFGTIHFESYSDLPVYENIIKGTHTVSKKIEIDQEPKSDYP